MEVVLTELSRYFIAIFVAVYTYLGFMEFAAKKKKRKRMVRRQRGLIYLVHTLGHVIIYMNLQDREILTLYACEMLFFILGGIVYKKIYGMEAMPILNHMQMLFSISLLMLVRLDSGDAKRQFAFMVVGSLVCLGLPWLLEHVKNLQTDGWFYEVCGLLLLIFVFLFGKTKYGARNWVVIGPVSLQPSEFSKIFFVLGFAGLLCTEHLLFKNIMKMSIMAFAFVGILVLEKDLGGALIFYVCYLLMLFVASRRWDYLFGGFFAGAAGSVVSYFLFSHVRTRVLAWSDPWSVIDNQGYQITQSLFAIGTGSWFGMGLTEGLPKTVPIRESDFIFSVISEEMGAIVAICLILIYMCCFIRFINISTGRSGQFEKYLTLGMSVIIMFQCFLALGGVTKFIPSTGVTLPLVSYGGSSMLSTIIMFGAILSVQANGNKGVAENVSQEG